MGTDVSVDIIADSTDTADKAGRAIAEIKNIFAKNEKIFSRFRDDSELAVLNSNLNKETEVSREMKEVLELCVKFNKLSGGYFDPRVIGNLERIGYDKDFREIGVFVEVGEIGLESFAERLENNLILDAKKSMVIFQKRMDTTGIAKGYTVDEAARSLLKSGFKNFIVDAGGDMYAAGSDADKDWTIGIEGLEENKFMLKLKDAGIATSGISRKRWTIGGQKFHHLINPKDPEKFSFDIKTVTVIADKTVEADGRAKVLVLMGKEKGLKFANGNNIKALFLDYRGNVYLSEGIKEDVIKNF